MKKIKRPTDLKAGGSFLIAKKGTGYSQKYGKTKGFPLLASFWTGVYSFAEK